MRRDMRIPRPLPRASAVWLGIIGGFAALDLWCDSGEPDGDTFTEFVRSIYRTDTLPGQAAIAATLGAGGVWLFDHFCKVV